MTVKKIKARYSELLTETIEKDLGYSIPPLSDTAMIFVKDAQQAAILLLKELKKNK